MKLLVDGTRMCRTDRSAKHVQQGADHKAASSRKQQYVPGMYAQGSGHLHAASPRIAAMRGPMSPRVKALTDLAQNVEPAGAASSQGQPRAAVPATSPSPEHPQQPAQSTSTDQFMVQVSAATQSAASSFVWALISHC